MRIVRRDKPCGDTLPVLLSYPDCDEPDPPRSHGQCPAGLSDRNFSGSCRTGACPSQLLSGVQMAEIQNPSRRRITIAIMALGGQGGGVLADWIIDMATRENYVAQGTSVPGVAQRTGATIYYIELFPKSDRPPVLALSPMPGDVDVIIAAELMEAGRAILRGFVDRDRTTLIASTHRIYAISEKSAMGDGLANRDYVLHAARTR